jgi:FtsP/CotA-like multicopper oxidase with cupredoxin domain
MRVKPGQSLSIKLTNNLDYDLGPNPPTAADYWKMLQNPGEHIKYQRYKRRAPDPSRMKVDHGNMPHGFQTTNLHLHGLDVEVHMFDPVGTHNPDAPHIAIKPGECYCFNFNVPDHHPGGMYWYHPHVHGATAIQMWSGMIGLLYVDGPLEAELQEYGITNTQEFVIWDPAFRSVDEKNHNLEVDEFLLGQTTLSKIHPFLVNGKQTPNFQVGMGEALHLRSLCATIENENTFIVYPEGMEHNSWKESAIPFWVIASDGVTFRKPRKKIIMVMSGGQRDEILLQFDEPGRYVISQQGIQGMQFFDMRGHPHDQILATITVGKSSDGSKPTVPISEMEFTPGYSEEGSIKAEDIAGSETIVFSMGADFDKTPFPQYYVNGQSFDPNKINFHAKPGEAREYTLINANHNAHPFHIHVNRFQVKEVGSELSTEVYPVLESVLDFDPDIWRDTFMVPPNGRTRIWVQYKNYTGKTVLHCHFLAHEDTGMMATLFIGEQDWVFRAKDHIQWIIGCMIGTVFSSVGLILHVRREKKRVYSAVAMNELKSKATD